MWSGWSSCLESHSERLALCGPSLLLSFHPLLELVETLLWEISERTGFLQFFSLPFQIPYDPENSLGISAHYDGYPIKDPKKILAQVCPGLGLSLPNGCHVPVSFSNGTAFHTLGRRLQGLRHLDISTCSVAVSQLRMKFCSFLLFGAYYIVQAILKLKISLPHPHTPPHLASNSPVLLQAGVYHQI